MIMARIGTASRKGTTTEPVNVAAAKQQKKADKNVAAGKNAIAKADNRGAKAEQRKVQAGIQKEKGYTHGVTVGLWKRCGKK